jgi:hypothetical protein
MNEMQLYLDTINNGGLTYNWKQNINLGGQNYFAVAMYPQAERVIDLDDFSTMDVRNYILDNRELLSDRRNSFGTWVDYETKKVYLDVSRTISDRDVALAIAKRNNQLAIFDLKKCEEISLNRIIGE